MPTEAELHEKYFYTQADMKRIGQDVDSYAKMKTVADYDRLMAEKHPGDKKLESQAAHSEKSAQKYYEAKGIGSFVYWAQEPDGEGGQFYEAKRQGKTPVEGGREGASQAEYDAIKLAERAGKLHGAGQRYGHLSNTTLREGATDAKGAPTPLDVESNKLLSPGDVEKMRAENNREMALAGVRDEAAKKPAQQPHAQHGR